MHFKVLVSVEISETNLNKDEFAKQIHEKVDKVMEPFYYETNNPDYLVFCDRTADLKEYYRLAKDRDQYASYEEYAEKAQYMDYSEELGVYGEYDNPNAFYDYYDIGDRKDFLIKDCCMEYIADGERNDTKEAPDGHFWVCAARKKDIEWKTMYDFEVSFAKKRYKAFVKYFNTGEADKELRSNRFVLCDKGIMNGYSFHPEQDFFYYKGETMAEYLQRIGYFPELEYPVFPPHYIQDGVCYCIEDIQCDTETEETAMWMKQVEEYISGLSDETVLVMVGCHA